LYFIINLFDIFRTTPEPPPRPKKSLHDLPLPPVLPTKEEETPVRTPPGAIEKELPRKKRPK